ncbi:MAG: peroxiredoxin family protein [Gemmatimonadota bacterium]|nr:peroxiredoxin family protein [Gemmatimonadota bacterium]MDE2984320.1 peroxiredoxin family protein [Gemmatimonadota bacterium]
MRRSLAIVGAVVVSFGLGVLVAGTTDASTGDDAVISTELNLPAAAERPWFPDAARYDNGGKPLSDESFEELMTALEAAMTAEETLADFESEADFHLWSFRRRIAIPEVGEEQQERIGAYLEALAEQHPDARGMIERTTNMLEYYAAAMPTMPDFVGRALSWPGLITYPAPGEAFTDAQVDRMLAAIDAALSLPESTADLERGVEVSVSGIGWGLQRGRMSDEQTARAAEGLAALGESYPAAAEALARVRFHIEYLMPGRVAPNIVGKDTEGVEFELEEYRGKIVAVIFSGQWCGPCRGEYPYQRAMLDLFDEEDVALLGVNSDAELETIVEAKKEERLAYRTWWDGHSQPDAEVVAANGPIATEWGVYGWPTIFVLDEEGVIRHTDKRGGALIETIDGMVMEKRMRGWEAEAEGEEGGGETKETDDDGPVTEMGRS